MAKINLAEEIKAFVDASDVTIVEDKNFIVNGQEQKVRSMDSINDVLEVGDIVTIPQDYTVLAVTIGDKQYPCIMATVESPDGSERPLRFFPNSLAKTFVPRDAEGKRMPKVKTTGNVAEWYSTQKTVKEAVEAMKGQSFKVTDKQIYFYKFRDTDETRNRSIYAYTALKKWW